jgi:hypothetical protein
MKQILTAGLLMSAMITVAAAQDWYHDRGERRAEDWRAHLFLNVRTDLENVWAGYARDRERDRLAKTEEELTRMQSDLNVGRWDNGMLNDVIDSIRKSSNDSRLQARDRDVLADDLNRLKDFQDAHNHRH